MTVRITALTTADVRFPTSRLLDGSDAMNPDPDYSAAYVTLETDDCEPDGTPRGGYGLCFTIGRGNEVVVAAIEALRHHVVGLSIDDMVADLGGFSARLIGDSQLRWLGPEKGVMHMAIGAVVNAAWDLAARRAGLPLWQFLSAMAPEQIADVVDYRYLTDALPRSRALELLQGAEPGRNDREKTLLETGYPAYTTAPGWLGYSDDKLRRLLREARDEGYPAVKLKVGADLGDDVRRLRIARAELGPDFPIMVDANQCWDVDSAVAWMERLAEFRPGWIEEPTSPDDVLGHAEIRRRIAPIPVVTGEHVHNRVIFKQLLQAGAIDACQIDACRVGGVNENIAIILLAAAFGVPVCPHAGGVGLCELVQHLAMFDFVAVSGTTEGRYVESVPHLHEHFVDPIVMRNARYVAPTAPGFSAQMKPESLAAYGFPDGPEWRSE